MTEQTEEPRLHHASFTVALKHGAGMVVLNLVSATAAEVLEWAEPILDYLRRDAEEDA